MTNTQLNRFAQTRDGISRASARIASRKQFLAILSIILPVAASAQTPDTLFAVHDSLGATRMSLFTTGGFIFGGTYDGGTTPNTIPMNGIGTRVMWYPEKAAFRAGSVTDFFWDDAYIGLHSFAAGTDVRASGDGSVAMGTRCIATQVSSFSVGEQNTASGAASVALGYHAHTNARQGSFVFADRSTVDTLRAGVNHSANWRVSGGFRIFTASNLATGVTIQSGASVSNWGQSNAVISTSTGAMLSTGGVWQNASDVNLKHQFAPISGEEVLAKLRSLSIQTWSYYKEPGVRHLGPTAQDFYGAFGLGGDNRSIGTVDADGVALVGVKALEARTSKLQSQCDDLKAENESLRARLDALEKKSGINFSGFPFLAAVGGVGLVGLFLRRRKSTEVNNG